MNEPILLVAMRYLHIAGAILTMGGLTFWLVCCVPSLGKSDPRDADTLLKPIRQRLQKLLLLGILLLAVSGTFNWIANAGTYRAMGAHANMLIGIKTLLAAVMFGVTLGRWLLKRSISRFWAIFNLHLGAIVVLLACVLLVLKILHLKN